MNSIEERFWEKVNKKGKDECWEWAACLNTSGYGELGNGNCGLILAHRLSWIIHFGEIPIDKLVLHKCDNTKCVNPNHLYIGTKSDNAYDMVMRGRCTKSRFYEGEAWLMKKLYRYGKSRRSKKFTLERLSKMFKCCPRTISSIVNEETIFFKPVGNI